MPQIFNNAWIRYKDGLHEIPSGAWVINIMIITSVLYYLVSNYIF